MAGEPFKHPFRRPPIALAGAIERLRDRGLNGPLTGRIDSRPAFREPQHSASPIRRIVRTSQEPLRHESLQHTSQRAWMNVQHGRQIASRHAGEQTDYT